MATTTAEWIGAPADEHGDLEQTGSVWSIASLGLLNLLLGIVTLGIWSFWGRAAVRRYLWQHTWLRGDALEYTGTGGELFRGALMVGLLIALPLFILQVLADLSLAEELAPVSSVFSVIIAYLVGVGRFRARRYRLRRTRWRGLSGDLEGGGWEYGGLFVMQSVLLVLTVGLTKAWMDVVLTRSLHERARLAGRPFEFTARTGDIFGRWLLCWLLLLPSLGMSYLWYVAHRERRFADALRWEGLRPRLSLTGFDLARLVSGNALLALLPVAIVVVLLVVSFPLDALPAGPEAPPPWFWLVIAAFLTLSVTLPILGPVWSLRRLQLICSRTRIEGEADWATIHATRPPRERGGEGLASVFDADAF